MMDEPLTPDAVCFAYMYLLGRLPEDADAVAAALSYGTIRRLREAICNNVEFEAVLDRRPRLVRGDAPALAFDWRIDDVGARHLLARLRAAWRDAPPGPPADAGALSDPDGTIQTEILLGCLRRAGIAPASLPSVFEFGCGGGRVTRHLAARFAALAGCDLSQARVTAATAASGNRALVPVEDLRFGMSRPFDLWYSHLTLQCYPPPLIARVLQRAFALLRPGGAAVFQVPTYAAGYTLDLNAPPRAAPAVDRHPLPQAVVFEIAAAAGCAPAEVFDDLAAPPHMLWRSSVFVLRKSRDG